MAQISVQVRNRTGNDYEIRVFDEFAQADKEVDGSPFRLGDGEVSNVFTIDVAPGKDGVIGWQCDPGGPTLSDVSCKDGDVIDIT